MLRKLNNIRLLRAITREFSIDVLDDMRKKRRAVTEEKRPQRQAAREQKAEYQEKNWTGQGRMPKPIARAIPASKTLESLLI
ncbi:H-NS family nucleoid-associated regulatory protein [Klebsiella sp. WOUb02]|uniref:H-NS family histone-like protein n=1 Tax=Klebsiella sp. WOUb02 TaxID=3161071 RepID=UPI003CEBDBCC